LASLSAIPSVPHAQAKVRLDPAKVEEMVLERSFGVKQFEMTREAVAQAIPEAKSIFDTFLEGSASYTLDKAARDNAIFGQRADYVNWNIGLSKEIAPTGTTLGLSLDNDWSKTSGSLVVGGRPIIPPYGLWEPTLGISLSQPLMKNAFGMNDRGQVQEARHGYASADHEIRYEVDKVIYRALGNYWTLYFTRKQVKALKQAIGFAQEFLNTTLEESKLGIAEETDVLNARANLLTVKTEYDAYRELERTAEKDLRTDLELEPDEELLLSDALPPKIRVSGDVIDDMIAEAMVQRGDYLSAIEELRRQRVRLKMARNKRWPQLDLVSTLQLNEFDRSYLDALGGMDSPNVSVGLMLSVPLENRAARAGARRAEADKARALYALKNIENEITNQITRLAQAVGERLSIVETARQAWNLNLQKQRLELDKYKQGRSSSDLVKRFQDDTIRTQRSLFEAWLVYQKTVLDLKLAQGAMIAERAEVVEDR